MPSLGHSLPYKYKIHSVHYLTPQLICRNMMRFKMAAMLDLRKPDHWPP